MDDILEEDIGTTQPEAGVAVEKKGGAKSSKRSGQPRAVINGGLVFPLVHLLQTSKFDLKKECAMAISNATIGCNKEQIKYLVTLGCTKPLSDLLKHENNEIYKKVVSILQTCRFEESDEPSPLGGGC